MTEFKKIQVLHIINGEYYAGIERILDLLVKYLPENGFEVGFACLKPDQFVGARQAQKAPLYKFSMHTKLDLRPVTAIAQLVRTQGYRLVHTHTARSAMIGRLVSAWTGVPMVHHFHSPTALDTTHLWRNRLNVLTERFSLMGVARAIANSESLGNYAQQAGIPQGRICIVPNGVLTHPLPERQPPKSRWTLGTVALFRPRKGIEVLLNAIALLKQQGIPVQLRAVGGFENPDYQAQIYARVADLNLQDDIDWRGFQKDVNAELAQMDLFILPSLFGEALPMSILEAMAMGVPVVGTQIPGITEAVRDGVDGLIAEPGNPHSLAEKIARIVRGEADWQAMRSSVHQRQINQFSAQRMTKEVAEVYQQVLSSSRILLNWRSGP